MRYQLSYEPGGAVNLPVSDSSVVHMKTDAFQLFTEGPSVSKMPDKLYVAVMLRMKDWHGVASSSVVLCKYTVDPPVYGKHMSFKLVANTLSTGDWYFTFYVYVVGASTPVAIQIPAGANPTNVPQCAPVLLEVVVDFHRVSPEGSRICAALNRAYTSIVILGSMALSIEEGVGELHLLHVGVPPKPDIIVDQLIIANEFPEWYDSAKSGQGAFNFAGGVRDGYPWFYRVMKSRNYSHVYEFDPGSQVTDWGYYPKPLRIASSNVTFTTGDYGMTSRPEQFMELKGNRLVSGFKFLRPYFSWKRRLR